MTKHQISMAAADIACARESHRTAQSLKRCGFPAEYVALARALRNSSLRMARRRLAS